MGVTDYSARGRRMKETKISLRLGDYGVRLAYLLSGRRVPVTLNLVDWGLDGGSVQLLTKALSMLFPNVIVVFTGFSTPPWSWRIDGTDAQYAKSADLRPTKREIIEFVEDIYTTSTWRIE